jgi:two-component system, LuxR family, response regulator FixJ
MSGKGLVYIVDDDEAVRDSLDLLLSSAGFDTLTFANAEAFLAYSRGDGRACVLSDIRMPGMSGIDLLENLRRQERGCPVVLITGHGDVPLAVDAMKRGAYDFIEKPFDDERLIDSIDAALAKSMESPDGENGVDPEAASRVSALSRRERQVMEGLIGGLSNKAIARDYGISPRTVEVYRANVMTKMRAGSLAELVQLAMRAGLKAD